MRNGRLAMSLAVAAIGALAQVELPSAALAGPPAEDASAFVREFTAQMRGVADGKQRPAGERLSELYALFRAHVALEAIGRTVVGRDWQEATPTEREAYREAFEVFALRTLARYMDDYRGETIEVAGAKPLADGDLIVSSRVRRIRSEVALEWRVRPFANAHRIADVVVEGLSLVGSYRSEFARLLRSEGGLPGLTTILLARAADP